MDLCSRAACPLFLICLLCCVLSVELTSSAPWSPRYAKEAGEERAVASGPALKNPEDLEAEHTVFLRLPPPAHFVWRYQGNGGVRLPQATYLAPKVVHKHYHLAQSIQAPRHHQQHGKHWSGHGAVSTAGHGGHHEHTKARKGERGKEDHKKQEEEKGGSSKGYHGSGGHGSHHDGRHGGRSGAKHESQKKHDKGEGVQGFQKSHHFDEQHKIRSFYDNLHTEGVHKQFGVFHEEDEGRQHAKHEGGKHESADHEDHQGKKGKHQAAKHHDEHTGHSSKDGAEKHHEKEEQHGTEGGRASSLEHQHSARHRR